MFGNVLSTTKGPVFITYSSGLSEVDGMTIEVVTIAGYIVDDKGKRVFLGI